MATDVCEPLIIRALEKDGWSIAKKPFTIVIRRGQESYVADFRAQRIRGKPPDEIVEEIVIFEVKCFTNPEDDLQEFYTSIGQYQTYLSALEAVQSVLPLYLAIPIAAYTRLMERQALRATLERSRVKLLLVDIVAEEIVTWIN